MQQTMFHNPYKFKVNIRPVKIAYFVKKNDVEALERLIKLICTQWGGIRHLIIPIDENADIVPLYKWLLELHEPHWFVSYWPIEENKELHTKVLTYLKELFPFRQVELHYGKHFEARDSTAHALHVISEEELEKQKLFRLNISSDEQKLTELFLYGEIYPGQQDYYIEQVELVSKTIEFGSELFWEYQFKIDPFASIVNLTSYGISAYKVSGGYSSFDYIDIVIIEEPSDLCLFWNLRALREVEIFKTQTEKLRRTICLPRELLRNKSSIENLFETIKCELFFPGRRANLDVNFICSTNEIAEKTKLDIQELAFLEQFQDEKIQGNPRFFDNLRELETQELIDL